MEAIYDTFYRTGLPLQLTGILVGLWLIATHGYALWKPDQTADFLNKFPRHEMIGNVLTIIGFAWTFIVWSEMDLGEFYKVEKAVQLILIAGCVGVIIHVKEFLAVRATGFLLILAAGPILVSAFLKEPTSRLLVVGLAYAGAVVGMFWVGMPYLMRDQIDWVLEKRDRLKKGAIGGVAFGALVLLCAIVGW